MSVKATRRVGPTFNAHELLLRTQCPSNAAADYYGMPPPSGIPLREVWRALQDARGPTSIREQPAPDDTCLGGAAMAIAHTKGVVMGPESESECLTRCDPAKPIRKSSVARCYAAPYVCRLAPVVAGCRFALYSDAMNSGLNLCARWGALNGGANLCLQW
eukprot:360643-Chlamydomonas_euryale.AAC.13